MITSDVPEESFVMFVTATIEYPIILAVFFLSCWADPKPKDIALDGEYKIMRGLETPPNKKGDKGLQIESDSLISKSND